jgi:hypothetical protein
MNHPYFKAMRKLGKVEAMRKLGKVETMTVRLAMLAVVFVLAFGAAEAEAQGQGIGWSEDSINCSAEEARCRAEAERQTAALEAYHRAEEARRRAEAERQTAAFHAYNIETSFPAPKTSFPAPEPSWGAAASALGSALANAFSGPSVPSYSAPRRSTSYNSGPSAAELARQRAEVLRWEAEQERKRGEVDALRERLEALRSGSGTPSYRESASPIVDMAQQALEAARENHYVAGLRAKVARLKARAEEIASEPIVQMGSAYLPVALATSVAAIGLACGRRRSSRCRRWNHVQGSP